MEQTKRSKVIDRKPYGQQDKYGNYSFIVKMENSDEGFYASTSDQPKHFIVGQETDYTIETLQSKAGKEYHKIRPISDKKPFSGGGFKSNFNPEADAKKQIMIILQSSLKEALQFHTINGYPKGSTDIGENLKTTWNTAEWFAKKILQSNLLNPATPDPAKNGSEARNSAKLFVEQSESPF